MAWMRYNAQNTINGRSSITGTVTNTITFNAVIHRQVTSKNSAVNASWNGDLSNVSQTGFSLRNINQEATATSTGAFILIFGSI